MAKKKPKPPELRALGLTCGIGSMLIGAKRAGFKVLGNVEWRKYYHATDEHGRNTFKENFPGAFMVEKIDEIPDVGFDDVTGVDLVMGHPECLPERTKIYTSRGWKQIKDVAVGDSVLTHKGRFRKVVRTYRNRTQDVVEIQFFQGRSVGHVTKKLVITPEHPVWVGGQWKKAGDVRTGDALRVLSHDCSGCGELVPFSQDFCSVRCAAEHQWKTASPTQRKKLVESCHKKTRELARQKKHHFFDATVRSNAMRALAKAKDGGSWIERKMGWALNEIGLNPVSQYQIDKYFVDFALPEYNIAIECDGTAWHKDEDREKKRDAVLEKLNWQVLHFPEPQILKDVASCAEEVKRITMNHAALYKFSDAVVTNVIKRKWSRTQVVCNIGVEEDESYVAKGYVVHNCGCFSQLNPNKSAVHDPTDIPLFVDMVARVKPRFFVMDDLPKSFIAFPLSEYVKRLPEYDLFPEWVSNHGYGNPQKQRKRMFMIGALKTENFVFRPGEFRHSVTVKDVIGDLFKKEGSLPNHEKHDDAALCAKALHLHHHGHRATWKELAAYVNEAPPGTTIKYHRLDGGVSTRIGTYKGHWEGPAHVMTGGLSALHPLRGNPFSVRERARIQGFPDDFVFYGTVLDKRGRWIHDKNMHMIRQTGKAMPIQFNEYVAKQIHAHILGEEFKCSNERVLPDDSYVNQAKRWYCETIKYGRNQERACEACWMRLSCPMSLYLSEETRKEIQDGFSRPTSNFRAKQKSERPAHEKRERPRKLERERKIVSYDEAFEKPVKNF